MNPRALDPGTVPVIGLRSRRPGPEAQGHPPAISDPGQPPGPAPSTRETGPPGCGGSLDNGGPRVIRAGPWHVGNVPGLRLSQLP